MSEYNCEECKDLGFTEQKRYIRGYKAIHNQRVRNYSGGRRPNVNDLKEPVYVPCSCETGEEYKRYN